jgi:hypothetical protein
VSGKITLEKSMRQVKIWVVMSRRSKSKDHWILKSCVIPKDMGSKNLEEDIGDSRGKVKSEG